MRSPLKPPHDRVKHTAFLKKKIPKGSVVHSYLFYDGNLEFDLASHQRFVCAHTTRFVVNEFWECAMADAARIHKIVTCEPFNFKDTNMFDVLQESWPTYRDPYVRAALFFILNQYSDLGLPSSGRVDLHPLTPLCLSRLRAFQTSNFHLVYNENENFISTLKKPIEADFLLIPAGKFNFNLFDQGKNRGVETTLLNHQSLFETVDIMSGQKWIILYQFHPHLKQIYKDYNMFQLDKYGKLTNEKDKCQEILIANF